MNVSELVDDTLHGHDEQLASEYERDFGYAHPLDNPVAGGSARPANWVEVEMNDARAATDDISEMLARVVEGTLERYADFGGRPLYTPEILGVYEWVAARWMTGEMGERLVARTDERTFVDATDAYDSVREAERDDADLITTDGTTLQIKTQTTRPEPSKIGEADELWWVEKDGDELREPVRIC